MLDLSALERTVAALDLDAVARARWFAGGGRVPVAATPVDAVAIPGSDGGVLLIVDLAHAGGGGARYLLPGRLSSGGALRDTGPGDPLWPALARAITTGARIDGAVGSFTAVPGPLGPVSPGPARALTADQSNTSVVLDERLVVKCYRRLEEGPHPEPELLAGLTRAGSRRAPRFGGVLVRRAGGDEEVLACLYGFVPGAPVGWEGLITRLRDLLAAGDRAGLDALAADAGALGAAAAELHVDLVTAFGARTGTEGDAEAALAAGSAQLARALEFATADVAAVLDPLASRASAALAGLGRIDGAPLARCHGDLHVAQLVKAADGPVVVDFEGEPGRPLAERRRPGSPLRDLACLLLSLDHVAAAAARRLSFGPATDAAFTWSARARRHVEDAYRGGIAGSALTFDPPLLRALELEKECQEVVYAATVLPEWSYAPALTLGRLLAGAPGP